MRSRTMFSYLLVLIAFLLPIHPVFSQVQNKRLILKDGSYQVVREYAKVGDRVRFFSAEREDWEEIPQSLVDWSATDAWAKDHSGQPHPASPASQEAAQLDREEQEDQALENPRTPKVLPGLRLPDELGIWALDTFQNQPELVELTQNSGNVNRRTGHNILRSALGPMGETRQAIEIPGAKSKVGLHVNDPAFYVSLTAGDTNSEDTGTGPLTVDTHGAGSLPDKDSYSSPTSQYAIVRVESILRHDYRVLSGVKISLGGNAPQTGDLVPTNVQILPGKQWMKVTPRAPLSIGEYVLVEVLGAGEVNASVWDFRVDPQSPDNKNAIIPLGPAH